MMGARVEVEGKMAEEVQSTDIGDALNVHDEEELSNLDEYELEIEMEKVLQRLKYVDDVESEKDYLDELEYALKVQKMEAEERLKNEVAEQQSQLYCPGKRSGPGMAPSQRKRTLSSQFVETSDAIVIRSTAKSPPPRMLSDYDLPEAADTKSKHAPQGLFNLNHAALYKRTKIVPDTEDKRKTIQAKIEFCFCSTSSYRSCSQSTTATATSTRSTASARSSRRANPSSGYKLCNCSYFV